MLFLKLTGKTRKEVDEFGNLEEHLDIEPLEMVDSRDNRSEPSYIALKRGIIIHSQFYDLWQDYILLIFLP